MKILSAKQIRALDAYTIKTEPIKSIDLMERASLTFVDWFIQRYPDTNRTVSIFCGIGNNGGDGLAVARILSKRFYDVQVYICKISKQTSEDFAKNYNRLPKRQGVKIRTINKGDEFPNLQSSSIVIDAIFGSGLNRPITSYWATLIEYLNQSDTEIVAIDIPSGLFADQHTSEVSIHASTTFSFELPKLAFLFPENVNRIGEWHVASIRLDQTFINKTKTPFHFITKEQVQAIVKQRSKFDHKGTFGHALLLVGSYGKMGAAILAAKACLRAGLGLLTIHIPSCGYDILQSTVPEAMVSVDKDKHHISELPKLDNYKAIGIGCGIDQKAATKKVLKKMLTKSSSPLVLDADALNIIAKNKSYLKSIPTNSILTPHPKEFERLFGKTNNDFERNELQRTKAQELGVYILLKGAHSCIACPDGNCYFNSTGNPGMATGGSGDVLTGMLTGLLAQGYSAFETVILGTYLHGLAGDLAADFISQEALIASDITNSLGKAYHILKN